jgi:hypothetical protein
MHAQRVDAGIAHAPEPEGVIGRLALALDRQIDRGFDADRALAQVTPSSSKAAFATSPSCSGVLRSMVRPAASDWPIAQNWQVLVRLW